MDLLVVRHAVAEDRETFARTGKDDAKRPLTREGRRKFEKGARGLRRIVGKIDLLATSPLDRATQTGDIMEAEYGKLRAVRLRELAPDEAPSSLLRWLRTKRRLEVVAIVGHEPHLSTFVEHVLVGRRAEAVELGKGGACLLALGKSPGAGRGKLRWLLTPSQLRRLGR